MRGMGRVGAGVVRRRQRGWAERAQEREAGSCVADWHALLVVLRRIHWQLVGFRVAETDPIPPCPRPSGSPSIPRTAWVNSQVIRHDTLCM